MLIKEQPFVPEGRQYLAYSGDTGMVSPFCRTDLVSGGTHTGYITMLTENWRAWND